MMIIVMGYFLRDAHPAAAAPEEKNAGDAGSAEKRRQSCDQ